MKLQFLVLWQTCGLRNISIVIKGPWNGLELVGRNSLTIANILKSQNMVKFGKNIKDERRKCKRTYTLKSTYKKLCLFKRLSFSQKCPRWCTPTQICQVLDMVQNWNLFKGNPLWHDDRLQCHGLNLMNV